MLLNKNIYTGVLNIEDGVATLDHYDAKNHKVRSILLRCPDSSDPRHSAVQYLEETLGKKAHNAKHPVRLLGLPCFVEGLPAVWLGELLVERYEGLLVYRHPAPSHAQINLGAHSCAYLTRSPRRPLNQALGRGYFYFNCELQIHDQQPIWVEGVMWYYGSDNYIEVVSAGPP